MNKHLTDIIKLAEFDKQIDALIPQKAQARLEIDNLLKQKTSFLNQIQELESSIKETEHAMLNYDKIIQEESIRLEQIAKKHKEIKSEKELSSLNIEEDLAKEKITNANAEIERLTKQKSAKLEQKDSFSPKIDEIDSKVKELEVATKQKLDEIDKIQQKLSASKESLVSKMDSKITSFYEKIRRWAANTSVVPTFKQACGGCFIRLNDTIYTEILNGSEIVNCPHCGRILYDDAKLKKKAKEA